MASKERVIYRKAVEKKLFLPLKADGSKCHLTMEKDAEFEPHELLASEIFIYSFDITTDWPSMTGN